MAMTSIHFLAKGCVCATLSTIGIAVDVRNIMKTLLPGGVDRVRYDEATQVVI